MCNSDCRKFVYNLDCECLVICKQSDRIIVCGCNRSVNCLIKILICDTVNDICGSNLVNNASDLCVIRLLVSVQITINFVCFGFRIRKNVLLQSTRVINRWHHCNRKCIFDCTKCFLEIGINFLSADSTVTDCHCSKFVICKIFSKDIFCCGTDFRKYNFVLFKSHHSLIKFCHIIFNSRNRTSQLVIERQCDFSSATVRLNGVNIYCKSQSLRLRNSSTQISLQCNGKSTTYNFRRQVRCVFFVKIYIIGFIVLLELYKGCKVRPII